jgi:hypothetical protein
MFESIKASQACIRRVCYSFTGSNIGTWENKLECLYTEKTFQPSLMFENTKAFQQVLDMIVLQGQILTLGAISSSVFTLKTFTAYSNV